MRENARPDAIRMTLCFVVMRPPEKRARCSGRSTAIAIARLDDQLVNATDFPNEMKRLTTTSGTMQARGLRQPSKVHAARAVTCDGIEIHPAVIAIAEGKRERAPSVMHDLSRIEIRDPAARGEHIYSPD